MTDSFQSVSNRYRIFIALIPSQDAERLRDEASNRDETAFLRDKVPRGLRSPDASRIAPYDAVSRPTFSASRFPLLANVSPWHVGSETRSLPATINQFDFTTAYLR